MAMKKSREACLVSSQQNFLCSFVTPKQKLLCLVPVLTVMLLTFLSRALTFMLSEDDVYRT